ncbi:hypothetical protein BKA66DRAFT_470469 [Pyrenochaeta sp. MPI-SDFR-AT-0127]|nr:hypothetical protein BKA66DRAFT_470469 [Pyrenochaeta sp. MPI-SDFR-AT-0127]
MQFVVILALFFVTVYGATLNTRQEINAHGLNFTLTGPPDEQYWLLTEENLPEGISRTEFNEDIPSPRLVRRGIDCSGSHRANGGDCIALLNAINQDGNQIQNSPRDIRYNNCFLSWSSVVYGVRFEFTPHAREIFDACSNNGWISGLKRDVNIGGRTTTVCMSNRPNGCN